MKEELTKEAIVKVLEFLTQGAGFVKEQAPLYVQELLAYEKFEALVVITILIAATLLSVLCVFLFIWLDERSGSFDWIPFIAGSIIASVALTVLSVIITPINACQIYKINNAPRVFVMEHLR